MSKKILSVVLTVLSKEMQFPDCQGRACVKPGDAFYTPANEMCFNNLIAVILAMASTQHCCVIV